MTKSCPICGKGRNPVWRLSKLRGKYNPTVKRQQRPNLQWLHPTAELSQKLGIPAGQRVKVCAKCLKATSK